MTSASHAEGRRFDPGQVYNFGVHLDAPIEAALPDTRVVFEAYNEFENLLGEDAISLWRVRENSGFPRKSPRLGGF